MGLRDFKKFKFKKFEKYKYVALIIVIGIALMAIRGNKASEKDSETISTPQIFDLTIEQVL